MFTQRERGRRIVEALTSSQDSRPPVEEIIQRAERIRALRQLCRGSEYQLKPDIPATPRISMGVPALDALLPEGGLEPGWLVEWLAPVEGSGAALLALQGVRPALERQPVWAVVDGTGEFYPVAAQGWGVSLASLLLVRPASVAESAWTVEQCLRSPAIGLTWIQADRLPDRVLQRWKIAVKTGNGIGVLFRPMEAARRASWADVRLQVLPRTETGTAGRRVRVELLSCRGCFAGGAVDLELHDAADDVRLVSVVAGTTTSLRSAGA